MKNKTSLIIISFILNSLLSGCGGVKIEQNYHLNDFDSDYNPIYSVSTRIHINDWTGFSMGMPYGEWVQCTGAELKYTMLAEYEKAKIVADTIKLRYYQNKKK